MTSIERVALSFCLQHLESKGDGPTARRAEELRAGIDAEQDMGEAIGADEIPVHDGGKVLTIEIAKFNADSVVNAFGSDGAKIGSIGVSGSGSEKAGKAPIDDVQV
jgi:hypothetical protein